MIHRVKKQNDIHYGKYNGVGGKLEADETPFDCVIREVREESGLEIKNPILKGIIRFPYFDGKNTWTVFVYTAERFKGRIKDCDEGNLLWVDIKEIKNLNLWEGDRYFLKYVFKKNSFFYGVFHYKNNRLVKYNLKVL